MFDWPLMNAVLDNDVSLARTLIEDGAGVNYYYDSNGVVRPLSFTTFICSRSFHVCKNGRFVDCKRC